MSSTGRRRKKWKVRGPYHEAASRGCPRDLAEPGTVYAAVNSTSSAPTLFRSTDWGRSGRQDLCSADAADETAR